MSDAAPNGRVVLLVTSPRVAPGLLSWPAWERLREAAVVQQLKSAPGAFGRIIVQQSQKQLAAGLRPDPQAVRTLGPHIGLNPKSIIDAGGYIGLVPLSQLGAAGYPTDPGSVFDLQLSNGWNVVQIIDRQSFDDVKQQAVVPAAQQAVAAPAQRPVTRLQCGQGQG